MLIRKAAIDGILKIGSSRLSQQVVGIIITSILARLLTPKDFGLIGIVTIFTAFISVFSYLGLGSAIIQKRNISETQLSSLFWIGLLFGLFSILILILAAYPISLFYKESRLFSLIVALSINFVISPFYQIHRKLLEKELRFSEIAFIEIISVSLSGFVGVIAALLKFGVWCLVLQSISFNLFSLMLYPFKKRWWPKFVFDFKGCKEFIHFGLHMVGAYLTSYMERHIDFFIIGKILGATVLGYYSLAYRLMFFPVRQMTAVFVQVLFPIFSKIQDNLESIQRGYLRSIRYISLITFPLMTFLVLFSKELVLILFGEKWIMTAEIIKILAAAGAIQSIWQVVWAVFPAIGKPELRMKLGIYNCILLSISILIGSGWGIIGVAFAISSSSIIIWVISQALLNKELNLSANSVIKSLSISLIGSIIMVIIHIFFNLSREILQIKDLYLLVLQIVSCTFTYIIYILIFCRDEVKLLYTEIFRLYRYRDKSGLK